MFCMGGRDASGRFHTVIVDSDIRWSGNVTRDPTGPHPHKAIVTVEHLGTFIFTGELKPSLLITFC